MVSNINYTDSIDFTESGVKMDKEQARLFQQVELSSKHAKKVNNQCDIVVKEICGQFFDGETKKEYEPDKLLSMLYNTVITLLPLLAIDPEAKFGWNKGGLGPFSRIYESATNKRFHECKMDEVIRHCIVNALLGHGIIVSGVAPAKIVGNFKEATGYLDDPGQFFAECVDRRDFIYDQDSKKWDSCKFMGHIQDVPKEFAMGCGLYPPELIKLIQPEDVDGFTGIYDEIKLLHLYLPQTRRIVTIPGDLKQVERVGFLSDREYEGPEGGPYDRLSFLDCPGAIKSIPILYQILGLHLINNKLANKIIDRSLKEKDNPVGNFTEQKTLDALKDARDGEILVSASGEVTTIHTGGVSQPMLAGKQWAEEQYNRSSLNSDVLGGMSPQSGTWRQDEMLLGQSGVKIADFRKMVVNIAKSLCSKTAYWLWHDHHAEFSLNMTGDIDDGLIEKWSPEYREGEFSDFELDIRVFVGQQDTPQERYDRRAKYVAEQILPLAPYAAAQGKTINVEKISEMGGDLGIDDTEDFWIDVQEQEQQSQSQPAGSPAGDNTTINMGGARGRTPLETASADMEQ